MSHTFRLPQILDIAQSEGMVTVEDLAQRFDVTVQTIRRDLSELAAAGHLERVHGGAVLPSGVRNIGYEERRSLNRAAKTAIARTCTAEISDDCALFLGIGTTVEAVARELLRHRGLVVVTNNINVANILVANPNCRVIIAGGSLRRSDGGVVGDLTVRTIERFKFDVAVIGCSAMDAEGDLLDFDIQEVAVNQTILGQARRSALVADSSKFRRSAPARISSLREVDVFYTDAPPPDPVPRLCAEWGTEVRIAQGPLPIAAQGGRGL
ncbi:DeoR/GlpR transcriptional regulator [Rhodobacteraceae bacterium CCMM004]|nr:DeoR/GlpR transcriptional regulator [Rhodobacteraceae bacterium CCMM004]